ncbi:L-rhamnose mutarotase [Gaoshiqia sp. Z1-71]|uniref:L-rhamnose mutarotase n=1 Tax=Gaoshiqia hydrogeniformans TaxID=3290090 RepID=UPI003BF865D6
MKQTITYKFLLLPALLALLIACQPKGAKQAAGTMAGIPVDRVAIELILDEEGQKDSLWHQLGQMPLEIYQWKNHLVLFGDSQDTTGLTARIREAGINLQLKKYDAPMYVFDRENHCGDSAVTRPWRNYLLTANLVADSVMQQEYMTYHELQFEEWPEVAQGFCNADFQQLLAFRNGRRLMLVISIPADKTLDELNPKTEEDNPRMVEWNQIMSQYQEGIEGTEAGETWVFFEKI